MTRFHLTVVEGPTPGVTGIDVVVLLPMGLGAAAAREKGKASVSAMLIAKTTLKRFITQFLSLSLPFSSTQAGEGDFCPASATAD
jgi:hypothetical protein